MAITASDTGNQFADAWQAADLAVTGGMPANPTADQQAYGDAWNNEAKGIYGGTQVATPTAVPVVAAADVPPPPLFTQQKDWLNGGSDGGANFRATNGNYNKNLSGLASSGGYGSFKYGDAIPERGTPQWRDMSEYLAMGGIDPTGYLKSAVYQDSWNAAPTPGQYDSGGGA